MSTAGGARDQLNRLLALVPYLQRRGDVPVEEVAKEFGVPVRTVLRDIDVLLFCGLPGLGMGDLIDVDFDALEGEGVIRLSNADYLTRPLRLDATEAAALVVGLRTLAEGATEEERAVITRAQAKIEEAAGEAARVAGQVDVVDVAAQHPGETALRERLTQAVTAGRQVRLRHRSEVRDEVTERVVDPIAVSTSGGLTYLDAWCHRVEDRRLFRLDRIESAEVLDEAVTRPARLRPLDLSEGIFRSSPEDRLATLHLRPEGRWVAEFHPVESVTEGPDGSATVTLRVGDPAWLVRLALTLGEVAELLDPPDVVAAVQEQARLALAAYATDGGTAAPPLGDA